MTRVFIVAASAAARSGLESLLRRDSRFEIVGSGPTLASAGLSWRGYHPDVVLMDAADINKLSPRHRFGEGPVIVMVADDFSRSKIQRALQNGVRAIVGHKSSGDEIAAAVEAAVAGLTALAAEHMDTLLPPSFGSFDEAEFPDEPLTTREIEVLALLAEGVGNKDIAERLKVSEHTVKFHVSSILGKLGAASRTEAVTEGIRRGIVLL